MSQTIKIYIKWKPRHYRSIIFIGSSISEMTLSSVMQGNLQIWGGRYNPINFMFKYQARNLQPFQTSTQVFITNKEAQDFANQIRDNFPAYEIIPIFIDGQIMEHEEVEEKDENKE
jgi:hypothetical protein